MSILNLLHPKKIDLPKKDQMCDKLLIEIKKSNKLNKSIFSCVNSISEFNLIDNNFYYKEIEKSLNKMKKDIEDLQSKLLTKNCLLPKELLSIDIQIGNKKVSVANDYSLISMLPRVDLDDLKRISNKLNYCIFDEKIHNNNTNIKEIENIKEILKTKGYSFYFLSPLKDFNFSSFIKCENVYDLGCFWGNHQQTFNTLSLTLSVFLDLYKEIENLKKENKTIKKVINQEQYRLDSMQKQLNAYIMETARSFSIVNKALSVFIDEKNNDLKEQYSQYLNFVKKNNYEYRNNPTTTISNSIYISNKTNKEIQPDFGFDTECETDYRVRTLTRTINNILPIPAKPLYLKKLIPQFNLINMPNSIDFTNSEKELIKKELNEKLTSCCLLVAIKGKAYDDENHEVIVLSSHGDLPNELLFNLIEEV